MQLQKSLEQYQKIPKIPKSVVVQRKIGVRMINVKNRTKYHLQNKLKQFISHIFILFRKSLKGLISSNLGTKSLKVRALGIQLRAVIHWKVLPAYTHCCVCLLSQWCSGSYCCISNAPFSVVCAAYCQTFFFLLKNIASGGVQQQQYGAPFVKILYLTDLAQKVLSLRIYSYLCTDLIISACRDSYLCMQRCYLWQR